MTVSVPAALDARAAVERNKRGILQELEQRTLLVEHLPYYFAIHLNEPCNQKCIMCVPSGNHGEANLPFEAFVDWFEQVRPYAEHVTLIGGETLMYPHISPVLELLAQHPVAVTINTNATMLDEALGARLLALHELHLKWSIDAATAETYRRIRGRDHFGRVTSRIRAFAERAREKPNIHLIPVFVVMRENLHEVVPFVDFAAEYAPWRIAFHPVRHVGGWEVTNGTGWNFLGREQICEAFPEEFNDTMRAAAARAAELGVDCEVHAL